MDLLPNLIIAVVMMIIVLMFNNLKISIFVLIVLQVAIGAFVYIILSIITKNKNFVYLLSFVKERVKK